ncbi:MFS general substrate transporter [Aureobasidium pullulans]|nr:MFS general substrate transporter [Aureobasidium pullulans]
MQTLIEYRRQKKQASLIHGRDKPNHTAAQREDQEVATNSPDTEARSLSSEYSPNCQTSTSPSIKARLPPLVASRKQQSLSPSPSPPSDEDLIKEKRPDDESKDKISVRCEDNQSDQADPHNWSNGKRLWTTAILFLLVFSQGWVSACDSNIAKPASKELHVSQTTETLATALFLLGISTGSLVVGPLSEELGRNPVYLVPSMFYLCFTLGDALTPNFGAQITFRFLAGVSASPALSIYGGSLADLYTTEEREKLWPFFALSPLLSPILAPVAAAWIEDYLSWRWVYWIGLALSGAVYLLAFLCLPETFSPMIIQWRTHHLRQLTGNAEYTCDLEGRDSLGKRLAQNLSQPAKFFTTEPVIITLGFYLIVVYVVIFTFLNGFEFIFTDTYGLSPGETGLAFLGICIGALISTALTPLIGHFFKNTSTTEEKSQEQPPEHLLIPAIIASPFFAISIFWLGWTNYKSISYWSDYAATILFGYSMTAIFVSSYSYIINIYGTWSSSALGSITMARYFVASGMLVAARPMYQGIGVHWSLTFLGCLGLLCLPVPFLIYRYGKSYPWSNMNVISEIIVIFG